LIFAQSERLDHKPQTLGMQLRKRRLEMKLCITEAAPKMGVSEFTLWSWEVDRTFPKPYYHSKILAYLGYNPFPQ
jgi:predicted DNA-binding transcriptional regulator AlpA